MIKQMNLYRDERGFLIPVDFSILPFTPKRVFIVSVGFKERGNHAHYKNRQILLCLRGAINITYTKDGHNFKNITLRQGESFDHYELEWITFSSPHPLNSMMMSFCSEEYDPNDYIHNFEDFKRITANV